MYLLFNRLLSMINATAGFHKLKVALARGIYSRFFIILSCRSVFGKEKRKIGKEA
jgi:hypothetical protein